MRQSYIELLAVAPTMVLLVALVFTVRIDPYIRRGDKRTMRLISALMFALIAQNYLEYRLVIGEPRIVLRTLVSASGYAIRPAILVLFLRVVRSDRRYRWAWLMVGANAAIYLTALFSPACFWIDEANHFHGGPLHDACLVVSAVLLAYLLYMTLRAFQPAKRQETWIPVFIVLLIAMAVALDIRLGIEDQSVSFLTIAVVISGVFYYIWLHLQFVREHEKALQAEQRIQIMMSQIQPHFLFNTLNTIRALCAKDPPLAIRAIEQFSAYLRQNLDALGHTDLIPLEKELEHTRVYCEIERLRFPYIRVDFDIRDGDFLVPALTIQPLVENAIRHGVRACEDGWVLVASHREQDGHRVVIRDNGRGFDPRSAKSPEGAHIGIDNVRSRLEQMCGGALTIESRPGEGTTITLLIPDGGDGPAAERSAR